ADFLRRRNETVERSKSSERRCRMLHKRRGRIRRWMTDGALGFRRSESMGTAQAAEILEARLLLSPIAASSSGDQSNTSQSQSAPPPGVENAVLIPPATSLTSPP